MPDPPAASALVSVIVLNHNGLRFLKTCFDSLLADSYPAVELIMADNASTDDSLPFMREHYPSVTILETGGNIGYSGAYNLAVRKSTGTYVVLLNNDVEVTPGWLAPLIAEMEAQPDLAGCQPKLRHMEQRDSFEYAGASGGFMDRYGFPFLRGRILGTIEKDTGQYDDGTDLFWASGAALVVRREIFLRAGGLDDDFVHHMEEIDLCWRLHLMGYRLRVVPAALIYHYAGGTIKPDSYMKMYWNHRNSIFMLLKNYGPGRLLQVLPVRALLDGIVMVKSLLSLDLKRLAAVPAAYLWLVFHLRLILRKRRQVQSQRIRSDREIDTYLYPRSMVVAYYLRGKKTFSELWPQDR